MLGVGVLSSLVAWHHLHGFVITGCMTSLAWFCHHWLHWHHLRRLLFCCVVHWIASLACWLLLAPCFSPQNVCSMHLCSLAKDTLPLTAVTEVLICWVWWQCMMWNSPSSFWQVLMDFDRWLLLTVILPCTGQVLTLCDMGQSAPKCHCVWVCGCYEGGRAPLGCSVFSVFSTSWVFSVYCVTCYNFRWSEWIK